MVITCYYNSYKCITRKKERKYVQLQSAAGQKCIQNNIKKVQYMSFSVQNIHFGTRSNSVHGEIHFGTYHFQYLVHFGTSHFGRGKVRVCEVVKCEVRCEVGCDWQSSTSRLSDVAVVAQCICRLLN